MSTSVSSTSFEIVETSEAEEKGSDEPLTKISPLWEALHRSKDFEAVDSILKDGHNVNERWSASEFARLRHPGGCVVPSWDIEEDECVNAPIFGAVYSRQTRFVELLVQHGARVEARNKVGRTPLHEAVRLDDEEMVGALLKCGANIESRVNGSWLTDCTALHLAALDVHTKMVQYLIDHGAEAQSTLRPGWTALDIAILDRQESLVVALLDATKGTKGAFERLQRTGVRSTFKDSTLLEETARQLIHKGVLESTQAHVELYEQCVTTVADRIDGEDKSRAALAAAIIPQVEDALLEAAGNPNRIIWETKLCEACSRFQLVDGPLRGEQFQHARTLRDLRASAESGCPMCHTFVGHLKTLGTPFEEYCKKPETEAVDAVFVELQQSYMNGSLAVRCGDLKAWIPLARVDVHMNAAVAATEPDDRFGMESSRSFATVRAWLNDCLDNHSSCRPKKHASLPRCVLYVGDEQTTPHLRVTNGEQEPYAALGHLWDPDGGITTTNAMFSRYCKGIPMSDFPPAIKDVIMITRELGIKYLWIAALCIIQDSPLDFWQASPAMSDVYAGATVAIMAQDIESSSDPLLKSRDWSTSALIPLEVRLPTGTKQWGGYFNPRRTSALSRLMIAGQSVGYHGAPKGDDSALSSSVWTLQAEILSCRTLHCWGTEFSWSCNEKVISEREHHLWRRPIDWQDGVKLALSSGKTKFGQPISEEDLFGYWKEVIVQSFNRKADFPEDRIASISGILTRIEDMLGEKSIAGVLQSQRFWPSLCWRPDWKPEESTPKEVQVSGLSWSWLSAPVGIEWTYRGDEIFHPELIAWNVRPSVNASFEGSMTVRCTLWRRIIRPTADTMVASKQDDAEVPDEDDEPTAEDFAEFRALISARWPGLAAEIEDDIAQHCAQYRGEEGQGSGSQLEELPIYITNVVLDREADANISDLWYVPIATLPFNPPPQYGYPMYPEGLRSYISLMCLHRLPGTELRFRCVGWARAYERMASEGQNESSTPRRDKLVEFAAAPFEIELF